MSRESFIHELRSRIGRPYLWGGNGPDGYDCSGLICTCLNESGYAIGRTNAAGLFEHFHRDKVLKSAAQPGTLYFYGDSAHIHHVMAVLERWNNGHLVLVGARGGDESTTTIEKATIQNALVDIVDGDYWNSKFVMALDPFRT